MNRTLTLAMEGWKHNVRTLRRQRTRLVTIMRRIQNRTISMAFDAWVHMVNTVVRQRELVNKVLRRILNRRISVALTLANSGNSQIGVCGSAAASRLPSPTCLLACFKVASSISSCAIRACCRHVYLFVVQMCCFYVWILCLRLVLLVFRCDGLGKGWL